MIKRFNKATSLLVAAATVGSLVPAGVMAADYKRIQSEDGTIYSAVAYNGAFLIDGNIVDGDTDAVYLLKDGKYTELEDIDSGAEFKVYGKNYINIDEADYFLDLSTGKVTDDEIEEEATEDAQTALKKKIKNVDRYDSNGAEAKLTALKGNDFAELWYETSDHYKINNEDGKEVTIYTDEKGNYIDADYNIGKIKVTKGNDSVNLTNTDDKEKIKVDSNTTVEVKATIAREEEKTFYLGQDASNIYRFATINLSEEVDKIYGKTLNGVTTTNDAVVVIQKISKAQASDNVDDAKYAKTVTSYAVCDEDGKYKGNVEKFHKLITDDAEVSIVNGKIIARKYDDEKNEVTVQAASLKSKNGLYYLDVEDDSTEDASKVTVDANGNVWRLDGGFLYKFDNVDGWNKVYKVDGSMKEMSIYDDNNIVLWSEDDEVYSIISSKSTTSEENKDEVKTGWVENEDGSWNYLNNEGKKVTGWLKSPASGLWYYMDSEGKMMSNGWIKDNGVWYYLQESGVMKTGWLLDNGTWYYLQANGAMKTGWLLDNGTWYYLQANGAMKTGWLNDNGTWYYLNASGAMLKNTTVDGYRLGSNGAWIR